MPAAQRSMKPSFTLKALSQPNTSGNASPIGEGCTETRSPSKSDEKRGSGSRKVRAKKCRACGEMFQPFRSTQVICFKLPCAESYAETARAKRERKETREAKAKLKTRRDWLKEAQSVFNKFIRLRDQGQPCISCQRQHGGQNHAGHYLSTGARPELRFDERNVHLQCAPCNNHLSGNIVLYRIGLIARIGVEAVEQLEGPHEPKKYSIDDLKAIKATYAAKCRELEAKQCCSL